MFQYISNLFFDQSTLSYTGKVLLFSENDCSLDWNIFSLVFQANMDQVPG